MTESIPQKKLMVLGDGAETCLRQKGLSDAWEKEPPLAKKQRENDLCEQKKEKAAPFHGGSDDWDKVYSYEEKRLKSLVDGEGYGKWEKENRSWEIENGLVPMLEDWEKEYSYEEKRLKSLVDEDGYYFRWEKQHWLWERDNHRVPEEEELSQEEEIRREQLRFILSLSTVSLQDPMKAKEAFDKKIEQLRTKNPLTEEEKKLKEMYLDKTENWYLGYTKETLVPFIPGWDHPKTPKLPTVQLPQSEEFPLTPEGLLYLCRKCEPAPVISREEEREILAAEGRCLDGSDLTPYCKCNKKCYRFDTALEGHPPECIPIWLAYCRQYRQSHCFDIDDDFDGRVGPLAPFQDFDGNAELLMELANLAIKDYNEKECNVFKYKVLKIEKVNSSGYHTYWMTVKVSNLTLGTPIETFQIHAGTHYGNTEKVIYCYRPKEEAIIGLPSCEFCFGLLPETHVMGGKEP